MWFSRLHSLASVAAVVGVSASAVVAAGDVSRTRADADQLLRKIAIMATNGLAAKPAPRRTAVTEGEVNSFLEFHARSEMPPGVLEPVVVIEEAGRLRGRALVDLDELKKANAGDGTLGMLGMLSGRVPVEATGTLRSSNGVAQFQLEQALVSGVPVPKALLQQVVSYYSRSPEYPEGINLEAPFPLPANIRQIETLKGQAIVVQ
jgi:hypothetical protein